MMNSNKNKNFSRGDIRNPTGDSPSCKASARNNTVFEMKIQVPMQLEVVDCLTFVVKVLRISKR